MFPLGLPGKISEDFQQAGLEGRLRPGHSATPSGRLATSTTVKMEPFPGTSPRLGGDSAVSAPVTDEAGGWSRARPQEGAPRRAGRYQPLFPTAAARLALRAGGGGERATAGLSRALFLGASHSAAALMLPGPALPG